MGNHRASVEPGKSTHVKLGVVLGEGATKTLLRKAAMQRHLATLKTWTMGITGATLRSLGTTTSGLALTRALTTTDALSRTPFARSRL
jgi:hypothetical protein